jgi:hypothetical protein
MKHLAHLQSSFQHALLEQDQDAVLSAISTSGRAAATTQFEVYSKAYRLRLKEVLEIDYPVLAAALGGAAFDKLANGYIEAHPSNGYSLRGFGVHLAAFLREQPVYGETPVLAELAKFEWELSKAFYAADDPVITTKIMSQIPPEAWPVLQLKFHPSVQLNDFTWNAPQLWKARKADMAPPEVHENKLPVHWIIWRQDFKIRFRSLQDNEYPTLIAARQGSTFADMCEVLGVFIPQESIPLHAASILKSWVRDGLISKFRY